MCFVEKIAYSVMFILLLIGIYLVFTDVIFFEGNYVKEDGLIEWLTFVAHICSASLCFCRANKMKTNQNRMGRNVLVFIGLIFMFGAAEEISWGQRIFNFSSPLFFQKYNSQEEVTIHNLVFGGVKINKVFFGLVRGICVAFYFLIVPLLYRKFQAVKDKIDTLMVPVPRFYQVLIYLFFASLVWFLPSSRRGELLEFVGGWMFFFLILNPVNVRKIKHELY